MNKALSILEYVFIAIGVILLTVCARLYFNTADFITKAIEKDGKVVEFRLNDSSDSISYYPVVEFWTETGEKIRFVSSTGSNPPSYQGGDTVPVIYKVDSPEGARINSFFSLWIGTLITGGIGSIFLFIGIAMAVMGKSGASDSRLKYSGIPVNAVFKGIESNPSIRVNGRSPFNVVLEWTDPASGKGHIFRSENLWEDPSDYLDHSSIRVFIQQGNPRKYYVDLSMIPPQKISY